jgi:hypothetical protein
MIRKPLHLTPISATLPRAKASTTPLITADELLLSQRFERGIGQSQPSEVVFRGMAYQPLRRKCADEINGYSDRARQNAPGRDAGKGKVGHPVA